MHLPSSTLVKSIHQIHFCPALKSTRGVAVAGLAAGERKHAGSNGLKAGGGHNGGKPSAYLAIKSKMCFRGTKRELSREEGGIKMDGWLKYWSLWFSAWVQISHKPNLISCLVLFFYLSDCNSQWSKSLSHNVLTLNDMPNWVETVCLLAEQLVGQDVGQGHQIKLWKHTFDD